jgi:hypothetical protein
MLQELAPREVLKKDMKMTLEMENKPNPYDLRVLAEIRALCGPPPVLSSENVDAYHSLLLRLLEAIRPRDPMERMMVKHLADYTWEIIRYTRHKTLLMERGFRQRRDERVHHIKRKQAHAGKAPAQDAARATVKEVEAELLLSATEFDHADALERGVEYAERLDKLLNAAVTRRNDVFVQLERYRGGLGGNANGGYAHVFNYEAGYPGIKVDSKDPKVSSASKVLESDEVLAKAQVPDLEPASHCEVNQDNTPPSSSCGE